VLIGVWIWFSANDRIQENIMEVSAISKRVLKNVGVNIWRAVAEMEREFGAQLTHDSGHGKDDGEKAATWIFTFPAFGNAQLGLRMNKNDLTLYVRDKTRDGSRLHALLPEGVVVKKGPYTNRSKGVAASLLGAAAPYLNPSEDNPILLVKVLSGGISELLRVYLGPLGADLVFPGAVCDDESLAVVPDIDRKMVSIEELQGRLELQADIGWRGEEVAMQFEMDRLKSLGCMQPSLWIKQVSLTDVGRGYDIESTWPGQERCIEVKTSAQASANFYLTQNESLVLKELGARAWLYRVHLDGSGLADSVQCMQDPMRILPESAFTPVVFRITGKVFRDLAADPVLIAR
jgi:Domain of unknown function (DUF3883)